MGSRGASHPTKRRTDPAAEHCDPYELVDRAREGALDESSRRRLSMVLRSQRDAALELAWMELFDTVREPRRTRERLDAERVEHERTERIVQRLVAGVGGTASTDSGDDARTRRWVAVDAEGRPVDEDARTRRWPAVVDPEGVGARTDEVDDAACTRPWPAARPDVPVPHARTGESGDSHGFDPCESGSAREAGGDPAGGSGQGSRSIPRKRGAGCRASDACSETAPWSAARAPRRDETPRGTPLEARGRAKSWVALALTAALSIAAGWLAHGWWDAATIPAAPPVVASPPTR